MRRKPTVAALLRQWEADGWQVDHERQEVVVDGSWLPVHRLPYILRNYAATAEELHHAAKRRKLGQ